MPEIIKIENIEKLKAKFHAKEEYFMHVKKLNQALNHGEILKKVDKVIKFNQETWLKTYIDRKTDLR